MRWTRISGRQAKEADIAGDALKEKRQKEACPVILQFEKWMYETVTRSSQNSRIWKAISYTLPLLPRLSRYVNDGPTSGLNKPTRINLNQLGATWPSCLQLEIK